MEQVARDKIVNTLGAGRDGAALVMVLLEMEKHLARIVTVLENWQDYEGWGPEDGMGKDPPGLEAPELGRRWGFGPLREVSDEQDH